jgi:hypothetical protein
MAALLVVVPTLTAVLASSIDSCDRRVLAIPGQQTVDGKALNALFADLVTDPHGDLKGIVVLRQGKLVARAYFNGDIAAPPSFRFCPRRPPRHSGAQ